MSPFNGGTSPSPLQPTEKTKEVGYSTSGDLQQNSRLFSLAIFASKTR